MKNLILLITLFIGTKSVSQENVKTLNLNLARKTEVFQIVEEEKKQVLLFFSDKKNVRTIRLNQNFELLDSLTTTRPSNTYNDIVGHSSKDEKYYTYWTNSNNKEILAQCFDFSTNSVSNKSFSLDFEKEKTIKKITVNKVFYIVNIVKNTSKLHLYAFKEGSFQEKTIDLSDQQFWDFETKKTTLWKVFNENTPFENPLSVQTISNDSPPSLAFSANKRKVYALDDKLIFTFDLTTSFTQTLTIDLKNFTASTKPFSQPFVLINEFNSGDSNSFLLEDNLIQTKLNPQKMVITIKDLSGKEINSFEINQDEEIAIKNSEIIQENGSIKNTRILDKSNQLLRKIFNLNPTISCYKDKDIIYLTIGGVSLVQNNDAAMVGGLLGGFTGALIGAAISSNFSLDNLNSYKDRKVVYINCKLDSNFKHLLGDYQKLAFDKLREFEEKNQNLDYKTIFKNNSALYFGGYKASSKSYEFYKFED